MAAPKFTDFLPQETLTVDGVEYLTSAMPATQGLIFMEKYQEDLDAGKNDFSVMKKIICTYVTKDNMAITEKKFDIIFARKFVHLQKLFQEVLSYNFSEVFQAPDTEE
jgi:hypothetical protein